MQQAENALTRTAASPSSENTPAQIGRRTLVSAALLAPIVAAAAPAVASSPATAAFDAALARYRAAVTADAAATARGTLAQDEARHVREFHQPRWAATDAVLAAPAPSLAAVLEKLAIAQAEGSEPHDVITFVETDLRGLLARGRA